MGIEPKFTKADVKARMDKFMATIEKRQIQRLQYLGEQCVTIARENGFYTDQTGNLRSSVGYVIFKNGIAIKYNYKEVLGGNEGVTAGMGLAEKVGAKYKNGIALVVTAGMSYAVHVESMGKDVLTSAEIHAKQQLPVMVNELKMNINKAISE